jgi:Glycosyl transferase family 2
MSEIRIFGVLLGAAILFFAFQYFRGQRWKRATFVLFALAGGGLLLVSFVPDSVNVVRDLFSLGDFEYGRLLAILIISNIATLLLAIYTKAKVDAVKHLLDRSLRASAIEGVLPADDVAARLKSIMVIIPALNEDDNLATLLPRIPARINGMDVGVLVIDDGSTDKTTEVALKHGCLVARNLVNRGQGAASRVGYGFLARHNVRIGVTLDADNQHDPNEIGGLVEPILAGRYDLVIGSRVLGNAERDSAVRSLGVSVFSRLVSLVSGTRITDCSSGFKAFRIDQMAKLDLREDQFQSSEVLISAAKKGLKIGEVPIHIRKRAFGVSHKGTDLVYGLLWLKTMARSWWR